MVVGLLVMGLGKIENLALNFMLVSTLSFEIRFKFFLILLIKASKCIIRTSATYRCHNLGGSRIDKGTGGKMAFSHVLIFV